MRRNRKRYERCDPESAQDIWRVGFTFGMAAVATGATAGGAALISFTNLTSAGPVCRTHCDLRPQRRILKWR